VDSDPSGPLCAGSSTIQFAGYATGGRKVELETRSACHVYTANQADAYMLARVLENLYQYIQLEQ
jgi:hypothetical protein